MLSDEEKKAIENLKGIDVKFLLSISFEQPDFIIDEADKINNNIQTILNLIQKLQKENDELKKSIAKASIIIDEYANEIENDTKKITEYRKKHLDNQKD